MKRILNTYIGPNVMMPVKKGTIAFWQDAYVELFDALLKKAIGRSYDSGKFYIVYGVKNSGSGSTYNVEAGAVFANGIIYLCDAFSGTASGSDVLVGTITESFFTDTTADPVQFTDGSTHNVHQIKKLVWSTAAAGSADVNYSAVVQQERLIFNNVSGEVVSAGTGATTTAYWRYKIIDGSCVLDFQIAFNIVSIAGGTAKLQFSIDTPLATSLASGAPLQSVNLNCGCLGSDGKHYQMQATIAPLLGSGKIVFTSTDAGLPTGSANIIGTIIYPV